MAHFEPKTEQSSLSSLPKAAGSRGRRPSTDNAAVEKASRPHETGAEDELDEFGLPVRRPHSRSSSIDHAHRSASKERRERFSFLGRRAASASGHGRSASLSQAETRWTGQNLQGFGSHNHEGPAGMTNIPPISIPQIHKRSQSLGARLDTQPRALRLDPPSEPEKSSRATSKHRSRRSTLTNIPEKETPSATGGISEWSHQVLAPRKHEIKEEKEDEWQAMPALGEYDVYDDEGRLVARGTRDEHEVDYSEALGGAGRGYTRLQIDDDAKSTTSMDENTSYLFKEKGTNVVDEDEDLRDPTAQMKATKDMLTEGQRIAYVGIVRVAMVQMVEALEAIPTSNAIKKQVVTAIETMKMWSQKMMVRLYAHMEISSSEQVMIEQLAEHGVKPADLAPALMQNCRVANPIASRTSSAAASPTFLGDGPAYQPFPHGDEDTTNEAPPAYQPKGDSVPDFGSPKCLPTSPDVEIDLRWTVLCDLFLVLIADAAYDARSRVLLETVGAALAVKWLDVCRFEKRVTEALEMQEAAARENWNEAENIESRRKRALKMKYMMMGLATVGGALVIGLSAGLAAPLIGGGLAAGFTTIGVAGTGGFLAGAGGTAIITTGAIVSGGAIGVRASNRRMGAVRTFEYRPLHNNKRVNLIVTVCGWMNGKVDDVRLPFSTVDPVMGDIYSLLWEPDMLQSMGDTIRILATEALTQGLQQVLASTILTALMASLTLPIVLTKLSYLIDNPWHVSLDRADAAGLILADSLVDRNLGARPITLVGFSLGSRLIFSCLRELANKGAYGLVQNVYIFGSPVVASKDEFLKARAVVSGRFVNGYATNDWILGYLFRATSGGISRIAGLAPVDGIPGLENVDVTELVQGHMAYRAAMPRLLREVDWEVESDEFTEIEDPDPENHEKRQRELIREIEGARKEAEAKPEKRAFGIFKRGKLAQKKGWETYDASGKEISRSSEAKTADSSNSYMFFDVDAIRAELESEQMEIRQLESTLPPMKLDLHGSTTPHACSPNLHKTQSEETVPTRPPADAAATGLGIDKLEIAERPLNSTNNVVDESTVRPGLRGSQTSPPAFSPVPLQHNAWAEDEVEEDFGKEQPMKLSFA